MPKKQNIKGIKELESLAKSSEVDISADIVRLKQKLTGKTHDTAETIGVRWN
jgi:hypothetical protein